MKNNFNKIINQEKHKRKKLQNIKNHNSESKNSKNLMIVKKINTKNKIILFH